MQPAVADEVVRRREVGPQPGLRNPQGQHGAQQQGRAPQAAEGIGGALAWLIETFFSLLLGLIWGAIIVVIMHLLPFGKKGHGHANGHEGSDKHADAHTEDAPKVDTINDDAAGAGSSAYRADSGGDRPVKD